MKTYVGIAPHTVRVDQANGTVRALRLFLEVRNHSPTGFSWGYAGSGPAQLALAICIDAVGQRRALQVYQNFEFRVIAKLPGDQDWSLTEREVRTAVELAERQFAAMGAR